MSQRPITAATSAPPPVVVTQRGSGAVKANEGGYHATVEQRPPETGWDRWYDRPVDVFTFVLCVATVLLGISTTLLWWTTQRIAKDSEKSGETQAEKMERSAAAMEGVKESMAINAREVVRSVEFQKQYGQMQLRPYLTVLVGEGVWQDAVNRFEVRPKVLNTGHTTAKDVRWRIAVDIIPVAEVDKFKFPLPEQLAGWGMIVASHQDYHLSAILPDRVDDAEASQIMLGMGEKALLVWGYLSYRDGLKRRYWTTFAQFVWWVLIRDKDGNVTSTVMQGRFLPKHNRAN